MKMLICQLNYERKKPVFTAAVISSVWIYLLILVSIVNPNFIAIQGTKISCVNFVELLYQMSNSILIPNALLVSFGATLFFNEHKRNQLLFYKAMKKEKIFFSKLLLFWFVFVLFTFFMLLNSGIAYFFAIGCKSNFVDLIFWGENAESSILTIAYALIASYIQVLIGLTVAMKYGMISGVVSVIGYKTISSVAMNLGAAKYFFIAEKNEIFYNTNTQFMFFCMIALVYTILCYFIQKNIFRSYYE